MVQKGKKMSKKGFFKRLGFGYTIVDWAEVGFFDKEYLLVVSTQSPFTAKH